MLFNECQFIILVTIKIVIIITIPQIVMTNGRVFKIILHAVNTVLINTFLLNQNSN